MPPPHAAPPTSAPPSIFTHPPTSATAGGIDTFSNLALRRKRQTLVSINRHFSLQPKSGLDPKVSGRDGTGHHYPTLADIEAPSSINDPSNANLSSDRYYYYTMPSSSDPRLFAFNDICTKLTFVETFEIPRVKRQFEEALNPSPDEDKVVLDFGTECQKCIHLPLLIYRYSEEGKYFCRPKLRIITNVSSFSHHMNTSTLKLIYQIIWIMKNFYVVKGELEDKRNLYSLREGELNDSSTNMAAVGKRYTPPKRHHRGGSPTSSMTSTSLSIGSDSVMIGDDDDVSGCETFVERASDDRPSEESLVLSSPSSSSTPSLSSTTTSSVSLRDSHTPSAASILSVEVDDLPEERKNSSQILPLTLISDAYLKGSVSKFYRDIAIVRNSGSDGLSVNLGKNGEGEIRSGQLSTLLGEWGGEDEETQTICKITYPSASILSLWQGINEDARLKDKIDPLVVQEDEKDPLDVSIELDTDIWDGHSLVIESSGHISYIRLWFGVEGLNLQFELLNLLLNYDAPSVGDQKNKYPSNGDTFSLAKSTFVNCPQMSITLMESYSSLSNLLLNFNVVDSFLFYNLANLFTESHLRGSDLTERAMNLNHALDRTKDSVFLRFGDIKLEIPQHPIVLHEIFTRITTKLTETLNQFAFYFHHNKDEPEKNRGGDNPDLVSSYKAPTFFGGDISRNLKGSDSFSSQGYANSSRTSPGPAKGDRKNDPLNENYNYVDKMAYDNGLGKSMEEPEHHIVVNIFWKQINFEAALLPSLKALYNIRDIYMYGWKRDNIDISLNFFNHALILRSLILDPLLKLSPETQIVLPFVSIKAHYIWNLCTALQKQFHQAIVQNNIRALVKADLEIGYFERSLTTDLLNNLVFIQKVFMKEVNELLQRLTGMEQPQIPKFTESKRHSVSQEVLELKTGIPTSYLYMIHLKLKGLQLTASTPTYIALRFETSAIDFKLFNQIVPVHREPTSSAKTFDRSDSRHQSFPDRKFVKRRSTKISRTSGRPVPQTGQTMAETTFELKTLAMFKFKISVSLGQMSQNQLYEEAESDYNPLAHFTTTISMKNSPKSHAVTESKTVSEPDNPDNPDSKVGEVCDTEVIMVGVQRPHLNVQALALDKAILIYINYKTAYEYWNEQRAALKRDVQVATQQVMEKLTTPIPQQTPKNFTQLFLQLTIDNLGISLPLQKPPNILLASSLHSDGDNSNAMGNESDHSAYFPADDPTVYMVLTIEHSRIFAFSKGVFVCKGVFTDLCTRFSFDFDPSYDDWSPNTKIISQDKMAATKSDFTATTSTLIPYTSSLMDSLVCNSCHVKEGTYEVCSNTFSTRTNNPKWVLNINWNMRGVDFLANTYIGICLKNLIYTLTILTKEELEGEDAPKSAVPTSPKAQPPFPEPTSKSQASTPDPQTTHRRKFGDRKASGQPEVAALSPSVAQEAALYKDYEGIGKVGDIPLTFLKEYHDQARNLHLLKQLGASEGKIRMETEKLHNMENQVAVDYRHDIFRKLNKQSIKAALIKQPLLEEGTSQRPKSLLPSHQRQSSIACTNELNVRGLRHLKSSSFGGQTSLDQPKETDEMDDTSTNQDYMSAMSTSPDSDDRFDDMAPFRKQGLDSERPSLVPSSRRSSVGPRLSHLPLHPSHSHPMDLYNAGQQEGAPAHMEESKIDFDLDVKVNIESGTFILFNDIKDMDAFKDLLCKEKSFFKASSELCISNVSTLSHAGFEVGNTSPLGVGKNQAGCKPVHLNPNPPVVVSGMGSYFTFPTQRQSLSLLYDKIKNFIAIGGLKYSSSLSLPGLDVKVKYSSHNITGNVQRNVGRSQKDHGKRRYSQVPTSSRSNAKRSHQSLVPFADESKGSDDSHHPDPCAKSADLYIWITIRAFIKENKLDPHILEFIEAVLEPIPMTDITRKQPHPSEAGGPEDSKKKKESTSLSTADSNVVYAATTNFPVNVFVYLRVNPSSFRFSCLPVSRVECIIYLPSLDLIFTSKTSDNHPASQDYFERYIPRKGDTAEMPLYLMKEYARAGSGISVILFLSKFSLEIFHPYGGITTKNPASSNFSSSNLHRDTSPSKSYNADNDEGNGSTFNVDKNKARKKFLSLDIDYIQINVMRKRILADSSEVRGKTPSKVSLSSHTSEENQKLVIYLSGLCDFGSASFKYDMRRLNEILVFPKAWYRKSIAKRILLGEHVSSVKPKHARSYAQAPFPPDPAAPKAPLPSQKTKSHTINTLTDHGRRPGAKRGSGPVANGAASTLPPSTKLNVEGNDDSLGKDELVVFSVSPSSSPSSSSLSSVDGNNLASRSGGGGAKSKTLDTRDGPLNTSSSSSFQSLRSSDNTLDSAADREDGAPGKKGADKSKDGGKDLPPTPAPTKSALKWESLLVLAIRFEKVDIQMNMGNVMGNVNWNSQGWESHSRIYMDSEHHKNFLVTFGLKESFLDAKSGIVGGDLEMKHFFQTFRLMTNPVLVQVRVADAMLHVLQVRLDYMGSTILIARVSQISSSIKDDWDIIAQNIDGSPKGNYKAGGQKIIHPRDLLFSRVRLHTTLKWDHFQLLICQSTQSDMQKMCIKIVEFFQHQFKSSVAILPNFKKSTKSPNAPNAASNAKKLDANTPDISSHGLDEATAHYGFWLKIRKLVQLVTKYQDATLDPLSLIKSRIGLMLENLPGADGTLKPAAGHPLVLGGSFVFQGNHLSLACFYGINFRAKTWAIFSMREISVVFSSQSTGLNFLRLVTRDFEEIRKSAKLIRELLEAELSCPLALTQNLLFQLGFPIEGDMVEKVKKSKREMAIILKITRSHYIPPKSSTIQEWCYYAFCKSSIDEVESFPAIEERKPVVISDFRNVTAETIFSLPRLQINMKSEHSATTFEKAQNSIELPYEIWVKYDFLSDFEDHILVSVDAEVLAFLHDLVISYTNKNYSTQEKVVARKASLSNTDIKSTIHEHSDYQDDRNFICNTWRLEPTLRIMSWKGQHLEAYGVDYILHKLGFTHARLTIPKWIQRGAMDPLDKFISLTLYYILVKSAKFAEFRVTNS